MHFRPRCVCKCITEFGRGGHTGTAPTVSFGQITCGWFCLLVGEKGAHEPTPSVLYF